MTKLIKSAILRVAERYAKNRFTEVEVHKNPFGQSCKNL